MATPPRSSPGAGLAPLRARAGVDTTQGLTPQEDALVLGPMRTVRAEMRARGNEPGVRAIDAALPLVAQGLLALLRLRNDGLDIETGPGEFKVSTR
jgi:hypothetical protein